MDEKKLKENLLESLSDSDIPDLKGNIKAIYLERQEAKKRKQKRWLLGGVLAFSSLLVVAIAIPLSGALNNLNNSSISSIVTSSQGGTPVTPSEGDPGKFQAVTYGLVGGGNYISTLDNNGLSNIRFAPAPSSTLVNKIKQINPYMRSAEELYLGTFDYDAATAISYVEGEEYPYHMSLDEGEVHFREEPIGTSNEEYRLYGEYIVGDKTYEMQGVREHKVGGLESEMETEIWIDLENSSFLSIAYETEVERDELETEITYGIYNRMWDDDTASFEVQLSYEEEAGVKESVIEITTLGEEGEFSIFSIANNILSLEYEIEDNINEYEGFLEARIIDDGSSYAYYANNSLLVTLKR